MLLSLKHRRSCESQIQKLVVIFAAAILLLPLHACRQSEDSPDQETTPETSETTIADDASAAAVVIFEQFSQAWASRDYSAMHRLLSPKSQQAIDEETFVERYENIMNGIRAENLDFRLLDDHADRPVEDHERVLLFELNMDTLAGPLTLDDYEMTLSRSDPEQGNWQIEWTEALIFPHMKAQDQVQARTLHPKRGEIYDRSGRGLAVNGELITIGIVPDRFMPERDENIAAMADLLGISEEQIEQVADQATVPDWFYPVVTLGENQSELSAQLTAIDGVIYQRTEGRIYPGGAALGQLTGYVGAITAEELENHPDAGYTAHDQIGKMGLELAFEDRLRGARGGEIYLIDPDTDRVVREIARKEPDHGENITLTIDLDMQRQIYAEMEDEAGSAVALNPQTGEILALVSTPVFDPNVFQTYVPQTVRETWNESEKSYFLNRFNAGYAPGSVFKLVTAAIGLQYGHTQPDEVLSISGRHWQPDDSWGSYRVTRVRDLGDVDLRDALVKSDNIYFAMQALRIGRQDYESGAAGFAFGESLPIDMPFYRSQLANDGLTHETLLADTAYGQGEILVSSLHMALIYAALASDGDLMTPVLELKNDFEPNIWHEQAIRSEDVDLLRGMLEEVIHAPDGTAYQGENLSRRLLGKTGTAELKAHLEDEDAEENGWFIAMDAEQDSLLLAMMIEDVKDRGGSGYVVPFVMRCMQRLLD